MQNNQNPDIPAGWKGGFLKDHDEFAYPTPDLRSLPLLDNMANIDKLQRQQAVLWPEFSWETQKGHPDPKRCFQMFAPDISRIGYTDEGRVYSIICPQQGVWVKNEVCLNVEVTVTGQRGWVDEPTRELAADMTVEGKIWFSPKQGRRGKLIWAALQFLPHPYPLSKAKAIRVATHIPGNPNQGFFPLIKGETTFFKSPDFARHTDVAWTVAHLEVEIGTPIPTGDAKVDRFNHIIMKAFNLSSGNMLQPGNILTWNVWFTPPALVDQIEWKNHAEKWRESIDAHHGSPDGEGSKARFADGSDFSPIKELEADVLNDLFQEIEPFLGKVEETIFQKIKSFFEKIWRFFGG